MNSECMAKQEPLVSVIMPAYNLESYISRGVESVLRQTYSNIELIVVDDGSTDGTGAVLAKFERSDPRVIVITQKNGGVSAARNAALARASGKYICFLDGDDWMADDAVETLVKAAESHQGRLIACGFEAVPENEEWPKAEQTVLEMNAKCDFLDRRESLSAFDSHDYFLPSACAKLFSRTLIQQSGLLFNENLAIGEDQFFVFMYLHYTEGVYWTSVKKWAYLQRAGSAMHSGWSEKLDTVLAGLERMIEYTADNDVKTSLKARLAQAAMTNQMKCVLDHKATRERMAFYRGIIRENRKYYIARYPGLYYKVVSFAASYFPAALLAVLYKIRFGKDAK